MATGELTPAVQIIIEGPKMSKAVGAAVPVVAEPSQWLQVTMCRKSKRPTSWSVSHIVDCMWY